MYCPRKIRVCDMHTAGEPFRILESFEPPLPDVPKVSLLQRRQFFKENLDILRTTTLYEPRGHHDMYGCVILPPDDHTRADFAVLFIHNEGYSTMCGHGIIALGRYAVDKKLVSYQEPTTRVRIQCPCGIVDARVSCFDGKSSTVEFISVPSFLHTKDLQVSLSDTLSAFVDVVFGGAFYLLLPATALGLNLKKDSHSSVVAAATDLKLRFTSGQQRLSLQHPEDSDLAFLYGVIFTDDDERAEDTVHSNVIIFAGRSVDRSPCGSGVTARMAALWSRGRIKVSQSGVHKFYNSWLGERSHMDSWLVEELPDYPVDGGAVRVCVRGHAWYTAENTFICEHGDSLSDGFKIEIST